MMEELRKKRRGRKLRFDFAKLAIGQRLDLDGMGRIEKSAHAYVGNWNKRNPDVKVIAIRKEDRKYAIVRTQ